MSEAIFGLLGVFIGGAVTLGADLYKSWRDDRSSARVAARLVIREFRMLDSQLGHCIRYGLRWPWDRFPKYWPWDRFPKYEWPEHEPVLANAVNDELHWRKMEDVFSTLKILQVLGPDIDADRSAEEDATQHQVLVTLREDMTEAARILGPLAA